MLIATCATCISQNREAAEFRSREAELATQLRLRAEEANRAAVSGGVHSQGCCSTFGGSAASGHAGTDKDAASVQ
jgi:hypothetical protein